MNKVISLDFWGTVGLYNPLYSAARTKYFSELFALPEDTVKTRYKTLKRRINEKSANFGTATTPILALGYLIEGMTDSPRASGCSAAQMARDLADMFLENPPILVDGMAECLQEAADQGALICLSSNTDFIGGETIRCQFGYLPISVYTFSDLIGVAKPHREFFRTMVLRAREERPGANDFVHIGDNDVCDASGARRVEIDAYLVKSPQDTIRCVQSLLIRKAA